MTTDNPSDNETQPEATDKQLAEAAERLRQYLDGSRPYMPGFTDEDAWTCVKGYLAHAARADGEQADDGITEKTPTETVWYRPVIGEQHPHVDVEFRSGKPVRAIVRHDQPTKGQ